jgi:prepilin-type N-terminal cleavage/methylation domain-containing protein
MRTCSSRFPSGFTLVEIMASVTILALIAGMTFAIVFGAVKRSRYLDRELELQTEGASIVSLIAEDIRSAFIQDGVVPFFIGKDSVSGGSPTDSIALLTTATLPVAPMIPSGAVGEVEYIIEEREDGKRVLVRREQAPAAAPFDEGGDVYEVTDRIGALDMNYSDGDDWFDEWDSESKAGHAAGKLPKKVRIELTLREQDAAMTYRTIVAPVLAGGR